MLGLNINNIKIAPTNSINKFFIKINLTKKKFNASHLSLVKTNP